jgi:hypothetical protein
MDSGELEVAVRRLKRGKPVDVYFDSGEDAPARAFMKRVAAFGLQTESQNENNQSWLGLPARPRFLKRMFGGLLGFFLWFWFFLTRPEALITKVLLVTLICYFVSLAIFPNILGKRRISEVQKEQNIALQSRWTLAIYLSAALLGAIVAEPWIGVALIALALGGIACAAIIRKVNSSD